MPIIQLLVQQNIHMLIGCTHFIHYCPYLRIGSASSLQCGHPFS